jgi:hypothetical protein
MRGEEDVIGFDDRRSPYVHSLKSKGGRWKNNHDHSKGICLE